jgi:hypothetical protein
VAVAAVLTATFTGLVAISAGLAAIILAVFGDMVAFTDFALAVRAGAFGVGLSAHTTNI